MSQMYPHSWKLCATCGYWTGTRETNIFGEWVRVDSSMAKGNCLCRTSGWRTTPRQADSSCASYEKWVGLKK
ncbi:MAG: hypothetical protein J6L76_04075 [Clostridia bacterium]|nr:hypothetical protein [Clostridia bacterium]